MTVETKRNILSRRVGNTYFMDAQVRVPDTGKDKGKNIMEVDGVNTRSVGFTWPRQ